MKEKILAYLKTKLAGFAGGVEEAFLLEYAEHFSKSITDEAAIATTLEDGVIDNLKVAYGFYNKEVVKKTSKAQETALENFRKKHGLDENGKPIEVKKVTDPNPDEPAWFKTYREKTESDYATLKTQLEKAEKEKTSSTLSEKVRLHEKLKDIPASFLKGRNLTPTSEAEIDQLVASIETDYNGFKQEMTEKGVFTSPPPDGSGSAGEKANIDSYLNDKFPKANSN